MLISLPSEVTIIGTNAVEAIEVYDEHETYEDSDLVQYDPNGGTEYAIYGILVDDKLPAPHHVFYYYSETAPNSVTDGKNYSAATAMNVLTYEVSADHHFDTLALGHLIGDTVSVDFLDPYGNVVYHINKRVIDNNIDEFNRHEPQPVTEVLYSPVDLMHGSTIKIVVEGSDEVSIGTILIGLSIKAGFTNLAFQNKFRDFSPTETDQWGNVTYIDGLKVNIHSGKVHVPIHRYDYMNRLMLAIGGKEVILNGYGSKHNDKPSASSSHFYATMMIGRITKFALGTSIVDKRLGELASYTFEIEEIV